MSGIPSELVRFAYRNANDVAVMLGYDDWWQQDIRREQFSRLTPQQVCIVLRRCEGMDGLSPSISQ